MTEPTISPELAERIERADALVNEYLWLREGTEPVSERDQEFLRNLLLTSNVRETP